jgi:hypothetical protein
MTTDRWPKRAWCGIESGLCFLALLALVGFVVTAVGLATSLVVGADIT